MHKAHAHMYISCIRIAYSAHKLKLELKERRRKTVAHLAHKANQHAYDNGSKTTFLLTIGHANCIA